MQSTTTVRLAGARCAVCKKGTLELESSVPTNRPLGHTKRYFRCAGCQCVAVETRDDRFNIQMSTKSLDD